MGWLANQTEKADLRVGNMCVGLLETNFPEMKPRLEKVNCIESDKHGDRFTHWAITITNRERKDYFFSRCRNTWYLQMDADDLPKRIKPVDQTDLASDAVMLVKIALDNLENQFSFF